MGLLWGNFLMEVFAEVGVVMKEKDDFVYEDFKMEKRSGWVLGIVLGF